METDNQNSWNSLRSNLDRLTEIPGEPAFDTNAAWNKLNGRLENKPMHRKPVFYWAAAAVLLLLMSVALYEFHQPAEERVVGSPGSKPSGSLRSVSELAKRDEEPTKLQMQPVEKLGNSAVKKSPSVHVIKKLPVIQEDRVSVTISNQPELKSDESFHIPEPVLTEPPGVVQTKPAKLKVIHNNQLNSVIYKQELSVSNASTTFPPSSGNLRFSRNASDNIIQIKLSLTN